MAKVTLSAEVRGADEVARAFRRLPDDAKRELDETKKDLAERLARIVRAAGKASDRQSARAASTVRATGGDTPSITAGPHPLLFASEFGMNRRSGWYAASRYLGSRRRQFRPHRGQEGYWFYPTIREAKPIIDAAWDQACKAIVRAWGNG